MSQPDIRRICRITLILVIGVWWLATVTARPEGQETSKSTVESTGDPTVDSADPSTDTTIGDPTDDPSVGPELGESESLAPPVVLRIRVDSAIHPVVAEYIADSLAEAETIGAEALVVQLDTPGGLLTSTREITQAFLNSPVPVVVFVSPGGAQAASAGFFLLMAADFAAMAPGTNTGAAHPVGSGGQDIEGDMGKKVEEDSAASIRSLAKHRGRNVELAEAAVLQSRSFTADEALQGGLIDLVAPSVPSLLAAIHGNAVNKENLQERELDTKDAEIVDRPMPAVQSFLAVITRPEIAAVLMFLGMLGLYMELNQPGAIFPGVIGAISLILGFYALSILPINYAGFALLLLAVALFVAETQVPSFGLLTFGGAVALVLGAVMLFKDFTPEGTSFDLTGVVVIAAATAATMSLLSWQSLRVRRMKVTTGEQGLMGEIGVARSSLTPRGRVFVHGELWNAIAECPVQAAAEVRITGLQGLVLRVEPVDSANPTERSGQLGAIPPPKEE